MAGPNYGNWVRYYLLAVILPRLGAGPISDSRARSLGTFSDGANILVCGLHNAVTTPRPPRPTRTACPDRPVSRAHRPCNRRNGVALKPGTPAGPDSRNSPANLDPLIPVRRGPHTSCVHMDISARRSPPAIFRVAELMNQLRERMEGLGGRKRDEVERLSTRASRAGKQWIYSEDQVVRLHGRISRCAS